MKFLSHITILDNYFRRTTFVITKVSDTSFTATPVQNNLLTVHDKLPALYLHKTGSDWKYKFEKNLKWLSDDLVGQMLLKLEQKLEEIDRNVDITIIARG